MGAVTAPVQVRNAGMDDLPALAALFDGYRVFYGQPSDPERAGAFLGQRLAKGDSHLLLALDGQGAPVGFAQLYPLFTSVGTAPIELLNDLFVAPQARAQGVGRALLRRAAADAGARGAVRLELSTAVDNSAAQALYETEGWVRGTGFVGYWRSL